MPAPERAWPAVLLIGTAAGLAGLMRDVPVAAALPAVPLLGAGLLFLLARPLAWVTIFLALSLLLPPLPFFAGNTELPLHPAMAVFAAAMFVGWVRLREWRVERHGLFLASALFLGVLLLSIPLAFYYSGAAVGAQSVARWLLLATAFVVLAWTAWGPAPRHWEESGLLRCLLVAALFSSIFAVVDFFYQFAPTVRFSEQYIYLPGGPQRRAQGVFYDAGALGNFCSMMLALIVALTGQARGWLVSRRWLIWLPVPPLVLALLLSFSRGSVVNLAVALLVLGWLHRRSLWQPRTMAGAVALLALAAASVWLLAPGMAVRFGQRAEYTATQFFARPNEVLSTRLEAWTAAAAFLLENPHHLLLGIGYKSLPYTDYLARPIVADNMYLALLVETGLPGLAALLLLCAVLLAQTFRLARHADPRVASLGAFLFAFWCGQMAQMLSGDILTYWRVTPVYFALLGAALRRSTV